MDQVLTEELLESCWEAVLFDCSAHPREPVNVKSARLLNSAIWSDGAADRQPAFTREDSAKPEQDGLSHFPVPLQKQGADVSDKAPLQDSLSQV